MFLRLLVWRFDETEDWNVFGFITVMFGDRPAAVLLEIAIGLCADSAVEEFPDTVKKIKRDRYVDDGTTGGSKEKVEKMRGQADKEGEIQQVLGKSGLKLRPLPALVSRMTKPLRNLGERCWATSGIRRRTCSPCHLRR